MAILNSGFLVENPMDLTEPLEKLIKVGFGLSRDAQVEEIEVTIEDDEDEEGEDDGEGEEVTIDLDSFSDDKVELDLASLETEMVSDEL